jgi:NAD(P)-dependent dehydrogenase (short-subunit alcohol dehydrogenase family)
VISARTTGRGGVADAALADGPIDILVNNAGGYDQLSWCEATADTWTQTYEASGGLAIQPMAAQPHYNASLAARHNLTVSLARDLAGTGITANTVAPGAILTGGGRHLGSQRHRQIRTPGGNRIVCRLSRQPARRLHLRVDPARRWRRDPQRQLNP